jgi:hypothetical protein
MVITPAESKLECIVNICNILVGAKQEPPPDQRTNATQPNMELINLWGRHTARSLSTFPCNLSPRFAPVSL